MKNSTKDLIKSGIDLLKDPRRELTALQKKTLEDVVGNYMRMLLLVAGVAALFNVVFALGRVAFFDITRSLDINYGSFLNFMVSESVALVFSYLLTGTFGVFFISVLLKPFFKRIKYTDYLKMILYSFYPLLLFCWTPILAISLLVWSVFLFATAVHLYRKSKVSKNSINQRD
jgi:hypothetical protein